MLEFFPRRSWASLAHEKCRKHLKQTTSWQYSWLCSWLKNMVKKMKKNTTRHWPRHWTTCCTCYMYKTCIGSSGAFTADVKRAFGWAGTTFKCKVNWRPHALGPWVGHASSPTGFPSFPNFVQREFMRPRQPLQILWNFAWRPIWLQPVNCDVRSPKLVQLAKLTCGCSRAI